jgi:hypothetical protein
MTAGSLFVSFWHISLANLPEGNFTHRPVAPEEARRYISQARSAGTLHGVSGDDLIAPFRKRKRQEHDELCGVLKEHFGIELSLKDFCSQSEEDGKPLYHIQPLVMARVEDENRLLIVTCDYELGEQSERRQGDFPHFTIAPDSVKFHLIEAGATALAGELGADERDARQPL